MSITTSVMAWRRRLSSDRDERRHARVQALSRVVDAHAHAHDQRRPLALAEDEARSELELAGDVLDLSEQRPGFGVDLHFRLGAWHHAGQLGLGHEHVNVRAARIAERRDRHARGRDFARFEVDLEYRALARRTQERAQNALIGLGNLRFGGLRPGGGSGAFFPAGSAPQ